MTALSSLKTGGDSFAGEVIPGLTAAWGINPTFAGREYLATGYLKTYTADYASLAQNFKSYVANYNTEQYGVVSPSGRTYNPSSNSWSRNYYSNSTGGNSATAGVGYKIYYLGGNFHSVFHHYTNYPIGDGYVLYGTSFGSAATNGLLQPANTNSYQNDFVVNDSCIFNNYLFVGRQQANVTDPTFDRSAGSTYTSGVYGAQTNLQTRLYNSYLMAASPSRMLIFFNLTNGNASTVNGSVVYTDNGTSFTTTGTNVSLYPLTTAANDRLMNRLTWSPAGNCFIAVMTDGSIFTSPNGTTWTSRTAPTGMPTGINWVSNSHGTYSAHSNSVSLISLGSFGTATYLLRTTDGINFTLVDIGTYNLPFFQNSTPVLFWDGTTFVAANGNNWFLSSNGITWIQDYAKVSTPNNFGAGAVSIANGEVWSVGRLAPSSLDGGTTYSKWNGRYNLAAPQVVGDATGRTWASGSSYSPFIRIK